MSTQANALERANANAGKEYSVGSVDSNLIWEIPALSKLLSNAPSPAQTQMFLAM